MLILITNAISQTWLIIIFLVAALLLTAQKKISTETFPLSATHELKGLAILMVVLSHIGYFLVSDHRFLVPLSNYAGVGVDLFLILSGYGLTVSMLRKPQSTSVFYRKRVVSLYLPALLTVIFFTALDALVLKRFYPASLTVQNIFGIFPHADLFNDLNSPLWFITLILSYYLLFPLFFIRRAPWITAGILVLVGEVLIVYGNAEKMFPTFTLSWMYRLHLFAMPLGILLAYLISSPPVILKRIYNYFGERLEKFRLTTVLRYLGLVVCAGLFIYSSYIPFVGTTWKEEEFLSLAVALIIIVFWLLKPVEIKALHFIGICSFELYLVHWPLLSRYDPFYAWLPAGIATILSIGLLISLSSVIQHGGEAIRSRFIKPASPQKP